MGYLKLCLIITLSFYGFMSAEAESNKKLVIGFMGDVMLGRGVNEAVDKNNSYTYPLGDLLPIIKKNDINIINLETTFTSSQDAANKVFTFKAGPGKVQVLKLAGIDIANLANNHILDFGKLGMRQTIETLDKAGILHVGAGGDIDQASKPVILEKKGIKIAVLGYTDNEPGWRAAKSTPGINYVRVGDIEKIRNDIAGLKKQVDFVIVSIHWGPNMRQRPSEEFKLFAHKIIDAGADIIHGHSAHIMQGIEMYKSKLILYDTGDFIDDYVVDPVLRNDQSFLYLVTVDKKNIKNIKLVPVLIKNYQVNLAKANDYKSIIKRIRLLSEEFGTKVSSDGTVSVGK